MATKSPNGTSGDESVTTIDMIADDQFLTWDETTPKKVRKYIPKYKKWIEYLDSIPMDKLAALQARFIQGEKKDNLSFQMAILKEVMIIPALQTDESRRAAIHADGALISMIVNDVVSIKDNSEDEQSLGES